MKYQKNWERMLPFIISISIEKSTHVPNLITVVVSKNYRQPWGTLHPIGSAGMDGTRNKATIAFTEEANPTTGIFAKAAKSG